jgi:uncharacterized protein (TIGR02266 family)
MDPKRTILLADDAPMFRDLGSVFLARTGRVVTANNGFECLEAARRERPSVVVADLDMPCMAGDELCRRLKQDPELRGIPVILVTSTDLADDRARAVRAGADDVIAKPISRISLIQAVNRLLRGQPVRGLARVALSTRVQIVHGESAQWGTGRNLSRGGIFVEADLPMPPATEVSLAFELPGAPEPLAPTAQVVWRREAHRNQAPGMGLRFLALDRASVDWIDAFIYERAQRALAAAGGAS